jgi:minichromosome maintenance protein 10
MKRAHEGDKSRAGPVKKTRFITAKGIREAGRDSLGGGAQDPRRATIMSKNNDDDDELDII